MKIGCCVVLYNPNDEVIENLRAYLSFTEKIVVVDNSTENINDIENTLRSWDRVEYLKQNANLGIAKALNIGLTYLYDSGYEWALTMDQDSKFPVEQSDKILYMLEKYSENYSIIGLRYDNFEDKELDESDEIIDVNYWITSGNFVKLCDYKEVGGFNDDLFIDSVDHEFCRQLVLKNKCIGILRDYSLIHKIGSEEKILKLGKKKYVFSLTHPPIRNYYRSRNVIYLYKIDKVFYKKILKPTLFQMIGAIFCDKNKIMNIKMITKGIFDGIRGELGQIK